jgi:hypothetical protein
VTVVFCIPGNQFSGRFLSNWTLLTESLRQRGVDYILKQKSSSMVHYARMGCLDGDPIFGEKQIPFQGKIHYDYIMWIDSDIDFRPEQFYMLLQMDKPVVCGMYKMQNDHSGNSEYAVKLNGKLDFLSDKFIQENGLQNTQIPIDFSGMGWMLIKRGVIESMEYPWFRSICVRNKRDDLPYPTVELISEDAYFCRTLNSIGHQVWVHTGCVVGHEKTVVLR